jgi:murein DD-endopeptidase MepM/ murein hydrolase activator NlpD
MIPAFGSQSIIKKSTFHTIFCVIGAAMLITSCSLVSGGGIEETAIPNLVPADTQASPATLITQAVTLVSGQGSSSATPTLKGAVNLSQLEAEPTSTPQMVKSTQAPFSICSPLSIHPIEELREIISDPYHPPPPGHEERHQGVDFSYYRRGERLTIQGVGVQSVFPGRVAASIQDKYPYGNMVIIETPREILPLELQSQLQIPEGESLYALYAHLDKPPRVSLDEQVAACQALGEVGKSGNAAEPHLHLEMRLGPASHTFLGMAYYGTRDSEEERKAYVLWRTSWQFRHFDPMSVLIPEP